MTSITSFVVAVYFTVAFLQLFKEIKMLQELKQTKLSKKFSSRNLYWTSIAMVIILLIWLGTYAVSYNNLVYNIYISNFIAIAVGTLVFLSGYANTGLLGRKFEVADELPPEIQKKILF